MGAVERARIAIGFIGPRGVWNALRYAAARARLERRFARRNVVDGWPTPGALQAAEPTDRGARWHFARTDLDIAFLAPDLVRYEWVDGIPPLPYALAREQWPAVPTSLQQTPDGWRLATGEVAVLVQNDGGISFRDAAGRVLREERPPAREGEGWVQRAALRPEERVYGLGERAAPLNLRGRTCRMWNRDPGGYRAGDDPLYLCVPVCLGLHGTGSYLVFYENPFDATFDLGSADLSSVETHFRGGRLRTYFIPGPPARALARYTELTGRPPLPPRWALGYHQSRWGYRTAADVRAVAESFRQHDLPLHAVCLDFDYMVGARVFTVDPGRFPDLAGLAHDLSALGVRLITIVNPGVKCDPQYEVYREGLAAGHFCTMPDGALVRAPVWPGMCVFPDFTNAATRAWWGQFYGRLLDAGVVGYWHDMNEPAVFAAWGETTLPLATRHNLEGRQGDHREAHNVYGLLQVKAAHDALRAQRPEHRPFIISRSGWAGLQRYAWTWTGDTVSTWEALRQTIPTVLGLGLSGIAYTGPDIGGFAGAPSAELFTRWFQMAAFLPFFRNHAALNTPRREPWVFGEPYLSVLREFLRLRERLLAYLYTLSWEAAQTGAPLVRPLWWLDDRDIALWNVDDAFLLGNGLLIAPVLEQGVMEREVVLPRGQWYSLWDDACHQGPDRIALATPMTHIPVLVRAGSILPLVHGDRLEMNIYAPLSGAGGGQLYSDAGEGYGTWRLDRFAMRRDARGITLEWDTEGEFQWPYAEVDVCIHGLTPRQVHTDGKPVAASDRRYPTGVFRELRIETERD